MKTKFLLSLLVATLACVLVSNTALAAGEGQLVVKRSANFGANLGLDVYVDGKFTARLQYVQTNRCAISAGPHEIKADVLSRRQDVPPTVKLNVQAGKTYQLTGGWHGQDLTLQ